MVYAVSPTYPCERRVTGRRRNERSADGAISVVFDHLIGGRDRRRWKGTFRG